MPTPQRIPTTPDVVFAAIRQQLVDSGAFTDSCVFLVLDRDAAVSVPPSTIYGLVIPGRFSFDRKQAAGAGRNSNAIEWSVSVVIQALIQRDQGDRAAAWLLNASGVIARATAVADALHLFDPVDPISGNGYLREPMRIANGDVRGKPGKYGELGVDFDVKFEWGLPSTLVSTVH